MSNINLDENELLNAAMGDLDKSLTKESSHFSKQPLSKPHSRTKLFIVIICCVLIMAIICGVCINLFNLNNSTQENSNLDDLSNNIDFALHDDINLHLDDIEKNYLIDGFVPYDKSEQLIEEVADYADTLKNDETILSYEKNDFSVFMTLNDRTVVCYSPKIENLLSAGKGDLRVVSYELAKDELTSKLTSPESLKLYDKTARKIGALDKYTFSRKDNLDNDSVTIEKIKKLKGASIVIWSGHGGYGKTNHSYFQVDDNYKEYVKKYPNDALCDVNTNRTRVADCDGQILITGEFFDYYFNENDFKDTIFYFGACHSAEDDFLANILISKGARCIFGATKEIGINYVSEMLETIFDNLVKGKSAEKSLEIAKKINGETDVKNKSTIRIVGDKKAKLDISTVKKKSKSSKSKKNDSSKSYRTDYKGYADIIDNIENQPDGMYGNAQFDDRAYWFINGVVNCTCKDLNQDNIDELMICYGNELKYYVDIYSTINGNAKKIGTIDAVNPSNTDGLGCYMDCDYSKGIYIVSGTRSLETTFYSFDGTSLIRSDTFCNDSGIYCLINGESVSWSEYSIERNKYPTDSEFNVVEFYQDNPGDINKEIHNFAEELRGR